MSRRSFAWTRRLIIGLTLFSVVLLSLPILSEAATLQVCSGAACTQCDVLQLGQNIMNLLVSILGPLALLVITVGGFFTIASGGKSEYVQRGRAIVKQALLGFVITLASWVIVTGLIHVLTGTPFTQLTIACNDDQIETIPVTGEQTDPTSPTCLITQQPAAPARNDRITLSAQSSDDATPAGDLTYRWEGISQIEGETTQFVNFAWDGTAATAKVTITDTDGKSTSCTRSIAEGNCAAAYASAPPRIPDNLRDLAQGILRKGIRTRTGSDIITTEQVLGAWARGEASKRHVADCNKGGGVVDGSNITGGCWVTPSLELLTNLDKLVSDPRTRDKTVVTRLTNGRHVCTSRHYTGSGVDLGYTQPGDLQPGDMQSVLGRDCPIHGGNHWHCEW